MGLGHEQLHDSPLIAAAIPSGDSAVWTRCVAAALFSVATAPVVGHALGLAALRSGHRLRLDDTAFPKARHGTTGLSRSSPGAYDATVAERITERHTRRAAAVPLTTGGPTP